MNSNVVMQEGWVQTNGNWYYLNDNREMVSNTITPNGYKVDQSGKWDLGKPVSRDAFQICYSTGENEILLRMGQGMDNISGDYNEYKNNDVIRLNGKSIKLSGNDELIKLATWNINDMVYSISVTNGMKKDHIN
ncbi:hypothetical protein [Clostridium botulinum]|uniref:hypothetical protein n=1 Tax=Clostridium botulinum TaxID=1491 RepID=UPI00211B0466|nr:hypothetical protein [Clostridium botulinum]